MLKILLVVWLACTAVPTVGSAAVYLGHQNTIVTADLDGSSRSFFLSNQFWSLPDGGSAHRIHGFVCGVAVNRTHLYWSENGVIARVMLDGGAMIEWPVGGGVGCGLTLDDTHLYWASEDGVGRARLDGGGADNDFIDSDDRSCTVAIDDDHVYWVDRSEQSLSRAEIDGSDVEEGFLGAFAHSCGVAVSGRHIYWVSNLGSIGRAELDGDDLDEDFITAAGQVTSIAAYGPHLYWTNRGNAQATVGRAELNGDGANREFVVLDGPGAFGLAVDSRPVVLPPGESDPIRFGKLTHDGRRGAVYMVLRLPAAGTLKVSSAGLRGRVLGDTRAFTGTGPHEVRLKLWPRGKGRVARRIRRQLRLRGRAPAMFRLSFEEAGSLPYTTSKRLALRKGKRPAVRREVNVHRARIAR